MQRLEGAIFGNRYSGDDYGAVMNYARITPPAVKENYVDIAGGNSSIDLTEAVGGLVYGDGSIEFKFTLFSGEKKDRMKNDLHGKRMEIILERETEFYYDGRISCTKEERAGPLYELYFTARVRPYKYERTETIHTETISGTEKEILLPGDTMPVMPRILVEGDVLLTFGGGTYRLERGEYQVPEITLQEGLNRIRLSGEGKVRFIYRKGRLV